MTELIDLTKEILNHSIIKAVLSKPHIKSYELKKVVIAKRIMVIR